MPSIYSIDQPYNCTKLPMASMWSKYGTAIVPFAPSHPLQFYIPEDNIFCYHHSLSIWSSLQSSMHLICLYSLYPETSSPPSSPCTWSNDVIYEQPLRDGAWLQFKTHFIGYSSFCFDSWHWKTRKIWIRSVAAEIRKASKGVLYAQKSWYLLLNSQHRM